MGLEENSVDGSGAIDEEVQRQTENELVKQFPDLRKNPALLRMMVQAVGSTRGSALRPSEAVNSRGMIEGSDLDKDGFGQDMESWRRENMGNGFELPTEGFHTHQEIRNMDSVRADASKGALSPGRAFVQKALAGTNRAMESENDDGFSGNQDPNDNGEGGGKSVFDDRTQPGNPNPNPGKERWTRNLPAPGRFGLRRAR